jgi:transcription antitermination protein NusB
MSMGARRRARGYALQVLYALDMNRDEHARMALDRYTNWFDLGLEPRSVAFATDLVTRVTDHLAEIDALVQGASRNWRLERMSRVDRNVLRLAAGELRFSTDVPVKVVINEAVELAKRFGAGESPAFVNGILDRIAQNVRRE